MAHTITINDELWARYGGSPLRMRDVLWANAPTRGDESPAPDLPPARETVQGPRFGTPFTAGHQTWCPHCGKEVNPGDQAVMMDYTDPPTGRVRGAAFPLDCARERGWVAP